MTNLIKSLFLFSFLIFGFSSVASATDYFITSIPDDPTDRLTTWTSSPFPPELLHYNNNGIRFHDRYIINSNSQTINVGGGAGQITQNLIDNFNPGSYDGGTEHPVVYQKYFWYQGGFTDDFLYQYAYWNGSSWTDENGIPYVENTAPVITLNFPATEIIQQYTPYTEQGATAFDDEDGDITANIIIAGDVVDTGTLGNYTITYNVIDSESLSAVEVTKDVLVVENADRGIFSVNSPVDNTSFLSNLPLNSITFGDSDGTWDTILAEYNNETDSPIYQIDNTAIFPFTPISNLVRTVSFSPFNAYIDTPLLIGKEYSVRFKLYDSNNISDETSYTQLINFDTLGNVIVAPDPYENLNISCTSTWDIYCQFKELLSWAFVPSQNTLNNFSTLTLSDRAPIHYIYEVRELFTILTSQALVQNFELGVSTPIGQITFIDQQMINDVPFIPFMRVILTALVYFFGIMTLYSIARKLF